MTACQRYVLGWVLVVSPPFILTLVLWLNGAGYVNIHGVVNFAPPLAIGVLGACLFPIRLWRRALFIAIYTPMMIGIFFVWGLTYVCGAFGSCP